MKALTFGAHRSVLVMILYVARYIVGILVMSVLSEARYLLINFCNVLYLTPVTDT
jgi:hypothetical protein